MVAVVATVSVDVTVAVPVMLADVGFRVQVAGLVAPVGPATEQARATLPVNPLDGVAEITEVLPVVAPATRLRVVGAALRVKPGTGGAVTVTVTVAI